MKNLQYELCTDQVKKHLNFEFIIKRLSEIDFMKAILFNKQEILSFNYFQKPLVKYKKEDTVDNRLMNEINQALHEGQTKNIEMLNNYFNSMATDSISDYSFKIRRLLNSNIKT